MTARRLITIGVVTETFVSIRSWGGPGWRIEWRGRVEWCQPTEFLSFFDLIQAVDIRLKMAGLKLIMPCLEEDLLKVHVRRARGLELRLWHERKARRR